MSKTTTVCVLVSHVFVVRLGQGPLAMLQPLVEALIAVVMGCAMWMEIVSVMWASALMIAVSLSSAPCSARLMVFASRADVSAKLDSQDLVANSNPLDVNLSTTAPVTVFVLQHTRKAFAFAQVGSQATIAPSLLCCVQLIAQARATVAWGFAAVFLVGLVLIAALWIQCAQTTAPVTVCATWAFVCATLASRGSIVALWTEHTAPTVATGMVRVFKASVCVLQVGEARTVLPKTERPAWPHRQCWLRVKIVQQHRLCSPLVEEQRLRFAWQLVQASALCLTTLR